MKSARDIASAAIYAVADEFIPKERVRDVSTIQCQIERSASLLLPVEPLRSTGAMLAAMVLVAWGYRPRTKPSSAP